jgi:hypothetical protein
MDTIIKEERFNFISLDNKAFILAFNDEMTQLGYDFGGKIGSGYCWGKYMIIYSRSGVKSKNVFARIYIRDESIVLRFFLNNIDKHRQYIENAPSHIKAAFVGDYGNCKHDHDGKDGKCQFRKTYTIDNQSIEKCNGLTFEFRNPSLTELPDYIALFTEFFPGKKAVKNAAAST